jgi:glycosyltransferase involved in cell wall biosynthesis
MKIALVCDWLVTYAGAERVIGEILQVYPEADIFCVIDFIPEGERDFLLNKRTVQTFIQQLPMARRNYQRYLPLMPLAIEQLDLSGYDLVISSSHAVAKGILTGPNQLHISYVHSPIRYAWDLQHQYLKEAGFSGLKGAVARMILHYMRLWDYRTANGVDLFIANSKFIAKRIRKVYGREATVIYPPVDTAGFSVEVAKQDYYFTASRFVPYKKIGLIVEAFNKMPDKRLVVIGDGTEFGRVRAAAGRNVELMGWQETAVLREKMQKARAFVFAAEEDFGITPVEAQACGTPVIAFGRGGSLETIRGLACDAPTGVFFYEQSAASICRAVAEFEKNEGKLTAENCRRNAEGFGREVFREKFKNFVEMNFGGGIDKDETRHAGTKAFGIEKI